jgi:hypothetical protein
MSQAEEVRAMRAAETVLDIIHGRNDRGSK